MRRISSKWIVPVGFALLLGVAGRGEAGGFFHKCDTDCNSTSVELPAEKIVVRTARPQVIVEETRLTQRGVRLQAAPMAFAAPTPFVATFFTPMAPTGRALFSSSDAGLDALADDSPTMRAAQDLELSHLRYTKVKAAHEAELAACKAVTDRIAAISAAGTTTPPAATVTASDLKKITDQIEILNKKMDRLEQYVNMHDEFLREQIRAGKLTPGAPPVKPGDGKE